MAALDWRHAPLQYDLTLRQQCLAALAWVALGAICLAAAERGVPVWSYPARQVKAAIVGYGAASKEQVQAMVARIFDLARVPTPHDVADAMAIALTAHRRGGGSTPTEPRQACGKGENTASQPGPLTPPAQH